MSANMTKTGSQVQINTRFYKNSGKKKIVLTLKYLNCETAAGKNQNGNLDYSVTSSQYNVVIKSNDL